jgi:hypothetical protein
MLDTVEKRAVVLYDIRIFSRLSSRTLKTWIFVMRFKTDPVYKGGKVRKIIMLLVSFMSPLFLGVPYVQFQECLMVKLEIMLNIINAKWDKISNGKKYNDTSKKTKKL